MGAPAASPGRRHHLPVNSTTDWQAFVPVGRGRGGGAKRRAAAAGVVPELHSLGARCGRRGIPGTAGSAASSAPRTAGETMEMGALPLHEVALRLGAACLVGACLGVDREMKNKRAGFRTHILLALGAALFVVMVVDRDPAASTEATARVLQGLASGLGFLSAGQILRHGLPTGVTTAANLWVVGALGAACGLGLYVMAAGTTAVVLIVLSVFLRIETYMNNRSARS
jgi:putative Mg2+ transporter-C (MgtC) family protein